MHHFLVFNEHLNFGLAAIVNYFISTAQDGRPLANKFRAIDEANQVYVGAEVDDYLRLLWLQSVDESDLTVVDHSVGDDWVLHGPDVRENLDLTVLHTNLHVKSAAFWSLCDGSKNQLVRR